MQPVEPFLSAGWQARLQLGFERRDAAGQNTTVLARREHFGPLRVQKALYPEGAQTCHAIVLHPPSGIAGGDQLDIEVNMGSHSHALLTTPGAGKWYRSAGAEAAQTLRLHVGKNATLEWLPQETIVFDGALARMETEIHLDAEARYIGWEVLCLGRRAASETFSRGHLHLATRITRGDKPIWLERGHLTGNDPLLASPIGLAGYSVCATLLATGTPDTALLSSCREIIPTEAGARYAITALPDLYVARYLGHASESARDWLAKIWQLLRPALIGREAQMPRIWST